MFTFAIAEKALLLASPHSKRWWGALLLVLLQFGCTSMQHVDGNAQDLQTRLRAGEYLRKDHEVTVFTNQNKEFWFRFKRIENDAIVGNTPLGEEVAVPIAEVAGIKTDRFSVGRTAAVVAGGVVGGIAAYMIVVYALIAIAGASLL